MSIDVVDLLVRRIARSRATALDAGERDTISRHLFDALVLGAVGTGTEEFARTAEAMAVPPAPAWEFGGDLRRVGLMAAAIRLTEADDIHLASCVTPSAIVIPAVLFATESIGDRGQDDAALAIRAAYDVVMALGQALDGPALVTAGIWPSLALASLGASVAVACLLGLDDEGMANAIAGAMAFGSVPYSLRAGAGPSMRWLGFSTAVAAGVSAARAASAGLAADRSIPDRLLREVLRNGQDVSRLSLPEFEGGPFGVVGMKPFSAGRQSLAAVEAFAELCAEHRIVARDISGIRIGVPPSFVGFVDRPAPFRDRRATLGAQYQLGLALMHPDDLYDVERLVVRGDAPMTSIASSVSIEPSERLGGEYPERWGAEVSVEVGTEVFSRTVVVAKGDAARPLGWADLRRKAAALAGRYPRLDGDLVPAAEERARAL